MLDLSKTSVDPKLLESGAWWSIRPTENGHLTGEPIEEGDVGDGPAIRIAPAGAAYQRAVEEERDRVAIDPTDLTPDQMALVMGRALAASVVRDWKGIGINGNEVPYSVEEVGRLLAMPELASLREFVVAAASDRRAVLKKLEDADRGN